MIASVTNMAWPEDPYGTGQLWRQQPQLLAAWSVCWCGSPDGAVPASYAIVYLRLHRTRRADFTPGVRFGFRALAATTDGQARGMGPAIDLDLLRARRLAKIVAGCSLEHDLQAMAALAVSGAGRGIHGLQAAIAGEDTSNPGMARVIDIASGYGFSWREMAAPPESVPIVSSTVRWASAPQSAIEAVAALAFGHHSGTGADAENAVLPAPAVIGPVQWLSACATERALICAVLAGKMADRVTWKGLLDISDALAANAGDCFSSLNFGQIEADASPAGAQLRPLMEAHLDNQQ